MQLMPFSPFLFIKVVFYMGFPFFQRKVMWWYFTSIEIPKQMKNVMTDLWFWTPCIAHMVTYTSLGKWVVIVWDNDLALSEAMWNDKQ